MIQIEREKFEKVLEALYCLQPSAWEINAGLGADVDTAITIIKDVLAQKDSEPVAWRAPNWGHDNNERPWVYRDHGEPFYPLEVGQPLYTKDAL